MLARVGEIFSATAGLAWAAGRHTVVLLAHPESEDGCKLIYAFNELTGEVLSGILNMKVIWASEWVAGAVTAPAANKTLLRRRVRSAPNRRVQT
jgi:hypothetical protein